MKDSEKKGTGLIVKKHNALAKVSLSMRTANKLVLGGAVKKFNDAFCLLNGFTPSDFNFLGKLQYDPDYRKDTEFKYKNAYFHNYSQSIKLFNEVLESKPRQYLAYEFIGIAEAVGRKDDKKAVKAFKKAIEINPNYSYAYYNLALLENKNNKKKDAIANLEKALKLDSKFQQAYNALACIQHVQKAHNDALANFAKAIAIAPKFASAYYNRALLHKTMRNKKMAMQDLDKAITLNPKMADAFHARGNLKKNIGDHNGAVKDFKQAGKLDKAYFTAYQDKYGY